MNSFNPHPTPPLNEAHPPKQDTPTAPDAFSSAPSGGPGSPPQVNHNPHPEAPPLPYPPFPSGAPVYAPPPASFGYSPLPKPRRPRVKYRATEIALITISLFILLMLVVAVAGAFTVGASLTSLSTAPYKSISAPPNTFAVIKVEGSIQDTSSDGVPSGSGYQHLPTLEFIRELTKDEDNKGILLYMNTGGGGVFESDEVYRALETYKEKTSRPIWAYMHQNCASGGYYISMAADKLFANYGATTGSIGVYIALTDSSGLYDKLGIESVLIRSGENKGSGVAGAPINETQREVYQNIVNEEHDRFVSLVSAGRKMDEATVRKMADGRPFSAKQALENGLVDELSDWETAQEAFKELTGVDSFSPNFSGRSTLGGIMSEISGNLPKSDLEMALTLAQEVPSGIPMMWAPGLAK